MRLAEILAEADNVEVNPCRYIPEDGGYYEVIHEKDEEPFCWTVYLHYAGPDFHGVEAVADCPTEEIANDFAAILLPLCRKR